MADSPRFRRKTASPNSVARWPEKVGAEGLGAGRFRDEPRNRHEVGVELGVEITTKFLEKRKVEEIDAPGRNQDEVVALDETRRMAASEERFDACVRPRRTRQPRTENVFSRKFSLRDRRPIERRSDT